MVKATMKRFDNKGNIMNVRFSKANRKLQKLAKVPSIAPYLKGGKRKVYSFDLLAGHTCPFADKCLSKAVEVNGKLRIQDGPNTEFRCYAASLEVVFPGVYNLHKSNTEAVRAAKTTPNIFSLLHKALPANAGVIRIHSSGDFFNENYFKAWIKLAKSRPDILFYAYTKNLKVWVNNQEDIPDNMILTASYGGRLDAMIKEHGLRNVTVVLDEASATNLDDNDSHAADPSQRNNNFQLLIHGIQPANTAAAKALSKLTRRKN